MADLADLTLKSAFYGAGGKDPGTSNGDQFKEGFGMVDGVIKSVLSNKKAMLENKKAQLTNQQTQEELTPWRDIIMPATPGNSTFTPETSGDPYIRGEAAGPLTPEQAKAKEAMEARNKFNSDRVSKFNTDREALGNTSLGQMKTVAQIEALRNKGQEVPMSIKLLPTEARNRAIAAGFTENDMIDRKTFNAIRGVDPYAPVSVLPSQEGIDRGQVPGNTKLVTPGQTGETAKSYREDRLAAAFTRLGAQMDNDFILKKLKEQEVGIDTANQLDDLVSTGNTVASSALGIKQAKGLGEVGVMTNQDVARYMQSGQLSQKTGDILSKWLTGAPTEATLQEILQINNVMKDVIAKKIQPIYNRYIDRAAKNYGISKEEAAERLGVSYVEPPEKTSDTPQPKVVQADDNAAMKWAKEHPLDPYAQEILKELQK